ncbi:MAG: hypothetical protein HFJ26_01430 [Clostridia bacterium]|nr:hypothetical protein [Clostridia bacterium]
MKYINSKKVDSIKLTKENLELYKSTFDIVLTDNSSFQEIENVING